MGEKIKKWSNRTRKRIPSPINIIFNINFNLSHSCRKCRSRWPIFGIGLGYYHRYIHWPNMNPIQLVHVVAEIWTLTKTLTLQYHTTMVWYLLTTNQTLYQLVLPKHRPFWSKKWFWCLSRIRLMCMLGAILVLFEGVNISFIVEGP